MTSSDVPSDWVDIEIPPWLWGGNPAALFETAGIRSRRGSDGCLRVRTEEAYLANRPDLITSVQLAGSGTDKDSLNLLADLSERAEFRLDYGRVQRHLDRIQTRMKSTGDIVHALAHMQGVMTATPVRDLEGNMRSVIDGLRDLTFAADQGSGTGAPEPVFPAPGVHLLRRSPELVTRIRIPSVLLRLSHDERLRGGDSSHLGAVESGGMMFPSSHGLYDGMYLFDAYLGPLQSALSPSMWTLAAPRTFGNLFVTLGRAIAGTRGDAAEPLQLVSIDGPQEAVPTPHIDAGSSAEAIAWWAAALNNMFAVLSDPVVFRSVDGSYRPLSHMNALITVEQLFRRVTSLLIAHRDATARRALLFTCLDTLENLTGRQLLTMCTYKTASKTLEQLKVSIDRAAHAVLLPSAVRGLAALADVQEGFVLARQEGRKTISWGSKEQGLEIAAAHYVYALRNATHGHGSNRLDAAERANALIVQHNGEVPHDLGLLAFMYLLDLLSAPERLRRLLAARAAATHH